MTAGGTLLAALVLVSTSLTLQVLAAEDLYWEGEEDASNEFLEVKDEDLGITGHLRRLKRGWFDFFDSASTTTEPPPSNNANAPTYEEESPSNGDDESFSADLGSGLPDRGDTENEPREKTLRVTFVVNHPYQAEYNKRDSQQFKAFSTSLADAVNQLFDHLPGTQRASLVRIQSRISDEFTCKVTLDIVTSGYENTDQIATILRNHIRDRRSLGTVAVSDAEFSSSVIDPGSAIDVCAADELTCDDGSCVVGTARCNGYEQCADGSDEARCPPTADAWGQGQEQDEEHVTEYEPGAEPPDQPVSSSWLDNNNEPPRGDLGNGLDETTLSYQDTTPFNPTLGPQTCRNDELLCDETRCVALSLRCDGHYECDDGADEADCEEICNPGDFRCDNGKCIEASRQCDRTADCSRGEDERNCSCSPDEFTCASDGSCIELRKVCDGQSHCPDHSDEANCACSKDQWQCDHGSCIKRSKRCDGRVDCPTDRSDERHCFASGYFRCRSGQSIPESLRCNHRYDCPPGDYSDEQNCPCGVADFKCTNGYCIPASKHCDGTHDCQDGSDERDCIYGTICMAYEYECSNGQCVRADAECNGTAECADGSDELNCPCKRGSYSCRDGTCINIALICNGRRDCLNGEDEFNCHATPCPADSFTCEPGSAVKCARRCDRRVECSGGEDEDNCEECNHECDGRCIPDQLICDGRADCSDRSDEEHCADCDSPRDFRCRAGGECLNINQRCNGIVECPDSSDERDCNDTVTSAPLSCTETQFQCQDGSCIDSQFYCDGHTDCLDGSDEDNCRCGSEDFQCSSGQCIPIYNYCDGVPQCGDGTDELNCPTSRPWFTTTPYPLPPVRPVYRPPQTPRPTQPPSYPSTAFPPYRPPPNIPQLSEVCNRNQWRCENGPCIDTFRRCDGHIDCPYDSSDEFDCPRGSPVALNLRTYPDAQSVRNVPSGGDVVFQCRDEGPQRAPVRWVREGGRPIKPGSSDKNGRLEMIRVSPADSGIYICQATGYLGNPGAELRVELTVDTAAPPQSSSGFAICQAYQATCGNGQCIPKSAICDGNRDCSDGSDEESCNLDGLCEPNQFQCSNRKCVLKTWLCDFENDCGDNSDEANCGPSVARPGECLPVEFRCGSGGQCVPKSFHCDGQSDCLDGSDEIGCAPVFVTKPPSPANVRLNTGDTLTLVCEAVGVPTPLISWRLNWGHVPPQCTSSSDGGVGMLICTNMQPEHSGAYSCEAINNRGTTFAAPDAIVYVNRTDVCPGGFFNSEARSENECIRCFCFGESTQCRSADLFTYNMPTPLGEGGTRLVGVKYDGQFQLDSQPITDRYYYSPLRNGATITKVETFRPSWSSDVSHPYLSLPESYNGNQLTSYGGYIRYRLAPHSPRFTQDWNIPDIIIKGKYENLVHKKPRGDMSRESYVEARLTPEHWQISGEGGLRPASREDIMMALDNIEQILLRADMNNAGVNITDFAMESAQHINVGLGAANLVEECTCPAGYEGLSCQKCASGYVRERSGPWLGNCVREQRPCPAGTYGDPDSGLGCRPCPCPLTNPENNFARTCSLGSSGRVVCDCAPGYGGETCEYCEEGYSGNPLLPGDSCRRVQASKCNPAGTQARLSLDECLCKDNVQGRYCDQCKNDSFYLSEDFRHGCALCFCTGVSQQCTSSSWRRKTTSVRFNSPQIVGQVRVYNSAPLGPAGNVNYNTPVETDLAPTLVGGQIAVERFDTSRPSIYYWSLPASFAGDKVTSYGGYLYYTLTNVPYSSAPNAKNMAADVQLISENRLTFHYFGNFLPSSDGTLNASVQFLEKGWQRADGKEISREHFLLALADVKAILVKATYSSYSELASIESASIETAEPNGYGPPALHVEQCICPTGYVGTSCEDCAPGFTRSSSGLYLEHCGPCDCNGHSTSCHPETGVCYDCRDNTEGDNCEYCKPNYEMANGVCRPAFSPTENPVDCRCDPRGTEGPCDASGTCRCKQNVMGQYCDQCIPGTFGLDAADPLGCMQCYCSGATSDCHEAGHYSRIELPAPVFGPNYGGYTITNLNADSVINDQFQPDPNASELSYTFTFPPSEELFWSLPGLPGNRVLSYGGVLTLTQKFETGNPDDVSYPGTDVVLVGDMGSVYWTNPNAIRAGEPMSFQVPLRENGWFNLNTATPSLRHDFMAVLKNLKRVLVRATLAPNIITTAIADVSMDTAVELNAPSTPIAKGVELCKCPEGYTGTSCETCAPTYYYNPNSLSCSSCPCNGHDCHFNPNAQVSVVCDCRPPYSGPDCSTLDGSSSVSNDTMRPPPIPTVVVRITSPSIKIEEVGGTVNFTCQARSRMTSGFLPVQWNKLGGELPQGRHYVDTNRGLLVISNLQISDSGVYVCQTSDGINTAQATATLKVPGNEMTIPEVSLRPTSSNYYEGDRVELDCVAVGNPMPRITWQRAGNYPLPRSVNPVDSKLVIESAIESDSGEYRCIATNALGSNERIAIITVRPKISVGPRDQLTVKPTSPNINEGQTIRIVCTGTPNIPAGSIDWIRQDNIEFSANVRSDNGVLYVDYARPENQGVYTCQTSSPDIAPVSVLLSVIPLGTPPPVEQPSVTTTQERLTLSSGESGSVDCIPHGFPQPLIKWRRHDGEFGAGVSQRDNSLVISSAQESDVGYYICEGLVDGNTVNIVYLYIDVIRREPPQVEIWPQGEQAVALGSQFELHCRVLGGVPDPDITWSRSGGRPLSEHTHIQKHNVLRFDNVEVNDEGEYQCVARNEAGTSSASAVIKVRSPPEITIMPNNFMQVVSGDSLNIECRAGGYPEPLVSISTSQDRRVLVPPTPGMAVLRIASVSERDEGDYVCTATSAAGTVDDQFVVRVDRGDGGFGDVGSGEGEFNPFPNGPDENQPAALIAYEGEDRKLECGTSEEFEVRWSRADNRPLQPNAVQEGSAVYLRNVSKSDSGYYVCNVVNRYTGDVQQAAYAVLEVVRPLRITLQPKTQTVRPGQSPTVQCIVDGDDVIDVTWRGIRGRPLPRRVETRGPSLIFHQIEVEDAGQYECVARARHSNESRVAEVIVNAESDRAPSESHENEQHAHVGAAVHLSCNVTQPDLKIRWTKDGRNVPRSRQNPDGSLFIKLAQKSDSGLYSCIIRDRYGRTTSNYINLHIEGECLDSQFRCIDDSGCIDEDLLCDGYSDCADSSDEHSCLLRDKRLKDSLEFINAGPPMEAQSYVAIDQPRRQFRVGENVEVLCRANSRGVSVTWERYSDDLVALRQFVETRTYGDGSMLVVPGVQESDAGVYRCTGTDSYGRTSYEDFYLEVSPVNFGPHTTVDQERVYTARLGQSVDMPCNHDLELPVVVEWRREYTPLPSDVRKDEPNIHLERVTEADAGTYVCRVSNSRAAVEARAILRVEGVVPRFDGNSWLALPAIKDAYRQFEIEISFKPTDNNGLILYNSEQRGREGDFVALELKDGVPVFTFDASQDPLTVPGDRPLQLNAWHTIRITRVFNKVTMDVDNMGPFVRESQSNWNTLELYEPLYIGGVPDYNQLPYQLADAKGFTGCVSLLILGREENIMVDSTDRYNVQECDTCSPNLCLNNGVCQEARNERGYMCLCTAGFAGTNCDRTGEACRPGLCGPGKCRDTSDGYKCACPISYTGRNCDVKQQIEYPAFTGSAYLAINLAKDPSRYLQMSMKIKASAPVTDGIIMYCAENPRGYGAFTSLAVREGRLEFRYDLGDGSAPVILTANKTLLPNEWTTVHIMRLGTTVSLKVNQLDVYEQKLELPQKQMHLETPMFVGGVDDSIVLNNNTGVVGGFNGCIKDVQVFGKSVDIVNSSIQSANVQECSNYDRGDIPETESVCSQCRNGGECVGESSYCSCPAGFSGVYCERGAPLAARRPDAAPCAARPCRNHGVCRPANTRARNRYTCDCPLGFSGDTCQIPLVLYQKVGFNGNGYLELPSELLRYDRIEESPVVIALAFHTAGDGVLLYQREAVSKPEYGDYILLHVEQGYVVLDWNFGSGQKTLRVDDVAVNNGERHAVIVRLKSDYTVDLTVDQEYERTDMTVGLSNLMNADSNIYIGGIPEAYNVQRLAGLTGCIEQVELMETARPLVLGRVAVAGWNAQRCRD